MKQMLVSIVALGFVVACAARRVHTTVLYPDSSSPCERDSPFKAPELRRARARDSMLVGSGKWGLALVIDSGATPHGLSDAFIAMPKYQLYARTDSTGQALLSRPESGEIGLTVRRIGYFTWNGVVAVRSGYRDTLRLGLAARLLCDM